MVYKFTIDGRPMTKKNSMTKTRYGLIQSKQYRDYEKMALGQPFTGGRHLFLADTFSPPDLLFATSKGRKSVRFSLFSRRCGFFLPGLFVAVGADCIIFVPGNLFFSFGCRAVDLDGTNMATRIRYFILHNNPSCCHYTMLPWKTIFLKKRLLLYGQCSRAVPKTPFLGCRASRGKWGYPLLPI